MSWKEKYKKICQIEKEENIYDNVKTVFRVDTPIRNYKRGKKEISFNPFLEYEKEKKFFDLNFKNFVKIIKLQVYDPDWFFFFISAKKKNQNFVKNNLINDHNQIDNSIKKRMSILVMIEFFILSLIPIFLYFIYTKIGIIELKNPSKSISFSFIALVYATFTSYFVPDLIFDSRNVWPDKFFVSLIFFKSKFSLIFINFY